MCCFPFCCAECWKNSGKKKASTVYKKKVAIELAEPLIEVKPLQYTSAYEQDRISDDDDCLWRDFEIPGYEIEQTESGRQMTEKKQRTSLPSNSEEADNLNEELYMTPRQRKMSAIPSLTFELNYFIRPQTLVVLLKKGMHLPEYVNEQIVVSVLLSHSPAIYHSSRQSGPDPVFNEQFRFQLKKEEIRSEGLSLKFNVWTVDNYSRKTAFGCVVSQVKNVLEQHGCLPPRGKGNVCVQVMKSDVLTDESLQGEVLLSLNYLPSAGRISVILIKANDLNLHGTEKELTVRVSLQQNEDIIRSKLISVKELSRNPMFHEEIVFCLSRKKKQLNIQSLSIHVSLLCKTSRRRDSRPIGRCILGNSRHASREGIEHWDDMISNCRSPVAKWHTLMMTS